MDESKMFLRKLISDDHVLRVAPFRNLWLGQSISQIGDALYYVSFMYMVAQLTGRVEMVGFIGAVEVLPFFIFGPYTGVLADRMDRRLILLWSDLISGFLLLGLALMGLFVSSPPIWSLFVTVFLLSTVRAFFMPTNQATIPALVSNDKVMAAIAFSMATMNFMRMGGLAFSATVMGAVFASSAKWFFVAICVLNAISFLGSAFFVAKLPPVLPDRDHTEEHHVWREFKEGFLYVVRDRVLLTFRIVGPLFSLMVAPFFVVYVAANKEWFGNKPQILAWFELAFFAGMIFGSAWCSKWNPKRPGASFCIALAVVGVAVSVMGLGHNFWFFLFWNIVCGVAVPFADIPTQTYTSLAVPDAMRGRVNSLAMMSWTAVMPIGMALAGIVMAKFGLDNMFWIMGIGMLIVTMGGLMVRDFRRAEMPTAVPRLIDEVIVAEPERATA